MVKQVNPVDLYNKIKAKSSKPLIGPPVHQDPTTLISDAEDALAKYKKNIEGLGVAAPPFHFFLREVAEKIVLKHFNDPLLPYDKRLELIKEISGKVEWEYTQSLKPGKRSLTNEEKFTDIVERLQEFLVIDDAQYKEVKESAKKFSDLRRYVKEVSEILTHSYGYDLNEENGQKIQQDLQRRIDDYYDNYLKTEGKGIKLPGEGEQERLFIHKIISEREALKLEQAEKKKEVEKETSKALTKRIGLPITIIEYEKVFQAAEKGSNFESYVKDIAEVFWPPENNNPGKDALRDNLRKDIIQRQQDLKAGKAKNYLNDDALLTADAMKSLHDQFPKANEEFIASRIAQEKEYLSDIQKLTDALILAKESDPSVIAAITNTLFDDEQKKLLAGKEQEIVKLAATHIFDKDPPSTLEEFAKAIAEQIVIDDPKQKDHIHYFEGYIKSIVEPEFKKCIDAKNNLVIAEKEAAEANAALSSATATEETQQPQHHARSAKELGLAEFLLEAIKILAKAAAIKVTSMALFTGIGTAAARKTRGKGRQVAKAVTKGAQIVVEATAMHNVNKQLEELFTRFMGAPPEEAPTKTTKAQVPSGPSPAAVEKAEALKQAAVKAATTLQEASKAVGLSHKVTQGKRFVGVVERSRKARSQNQGKQ